MNPGSCSVLFGQQTLPHLLPEIIAYHAVTIMIACSDLYPEPVPKFVIASNTGSQYLVLCLNHNKIPQILACICISLSRAKSIHKALLLHKVHHLIFVCGICLIDGICKLFSHHFRFLKWLMLQISDCTIDQT